MAKKKQTVWKTREQDFLVFCHAARYFLRLYGTHHWKVIFEHEDNDATEGAYAAVRSSTGTGQVATIYLAKSWDRPPSVSSIIMSAFHETQHLLFGSMYNIALYDEMLPEQRDHQYRRAEHMVIRCMENVILPLLLPKLYESLEVEGVGLAGTED